MKLFLSAACLSAFPVSAPAEVTLTKPFKWGSTLADKLDEGTRFRPTPTLVRTGAITKDAPVLGVAARLSEAAR